MTVFSTYIDGKGLIALALFAGYLLLPVLA